MATWVSDQQVPETQDTWLRALLLRQQPEPAIEHFDQALWQGLGGGLSEDERTEVLRTYGTFVLPLYLSADLDRLDLVATWANEDGGQARPLDRLDELLADEGMELGEVVAGMWASLQAGSLGDANAPTWAVAAAGADRIDLVLVPITDSYVLDETFDYRIRVDAASTLDEPGGCGCAGTPLGPGLPLLLLVLPAMRRKEGPC